MTNLEGWIIDQGLRGSDVASLLAGFSERLVAEGIPLARSYIALPTVNPTVRVFNHVWTRTGGIMVEGVSHERNTDAFEVSPFGSMLRDGTMERHWRFDGTEAKAFAVFEDVRREGGRDYLARLIRFENATAPRTCAASRPPSRRTARADSSPRRSSGSTRSCRSSPSPPTA